MHVFVCWCVQVHEQKPVVIMGYSQVLDIPLLHWPQPAAMNCLWLLGILWAIGRGAGGIPNKIRP